MPDFILDFLESKYSKAQDMRRLLLFLVRAMLLYINKMFMIYVSKIDGDLESTINAANAAVLYAVNWEIKNLPLTYAILTDSVMTEEKETELLRMQNELDESIENFNLLDYYVGNIMGECKSLEKIQNSDEIIKDVIYHFIADLENAAGPDCSSITSQIFDEKDIEYYKSNNSENKCPIQDDEYALINITEAAVQLRVNKQFLLKGLKKGYLHGRLVGKQWLFTTDNLKTNWYVIFLMKELGSIITYGVNI